MELLIFLIALAYKVDANCYTISLGGGASFGSYQAGVISGLANTLPAAEVNYSSVVGISAGSLNALGFTQYPQGSEKAGAQFLITTWLSLMNGSAIYEEWPGGVVAGLLFHSGLFHTKPEYELILRLAPNQPQRKLNMGTVEINSGKYHSYNETSGIAFDQHAAMCSSAIPMFFETQLFNGGVYNDGGVYTMFDAEMGVNRCLEETSNESEIFVDVVPCFRKTLDPDDAAKLKTPDVYFRSIEVRSYYNSITSLAQSMEAHPQVNFRYFIQPSLEISATKVLNFSTVFMQELITLGYNDAVNATKSNLNARQFIKDWNFNSDIIYP